MFKYILADEKNWAIFEKDNATYIKSKNRLCSQGCKLLRKIISSIKV